VPASIHGETQLVTGFSRYPFQGLVFFDALKGDVKQELACRVGQGDPLIFDDSIFISDRWSHAEGGSCLYSMSALHPAALALPKPPPPEYQAKPAPKPAAAAAPTNPPTTPATPTTGAPAMSAAATTLAVKPPEQKPVRPGPPDPTPTWCVEGDGAYWGNAVRCGDYIFTGEMKNMACISLKTGEVKWREKTLSNCQPIVCDGKVIVMNYNKVLVLDAGPEYKVLASADVLPATSSNGNAKFSLTPALIPGRLYCKQSNGDVVCLDVSGK